AGAWSSSKSLASARVRFKARSMGTTDQQRSRRWWSGLGATLGVGLSLAVLGVSCSESKPAVGARDDEGLRMCCTLGAVCHVADLESKGEGGAGGVGSSDGPEAAQECHWLGHDGEPDQCRKY